LIGFVFKPLGTTTKHLEKSAFRRFNKKSCLLTFESNQAGDYPPHWIKKTKEKSFLSFFCWLTER